MFSRGLKQNIILLVTVTIVTTFIISYKVSVIHSKYKSLRKETIERDRKVILYWNDFYGYTSLNLGLGQNIFKDCPTSACYATKYREYLPEEKYDAIVFHGNQWNYRKDGAPIRRSPHQKYVFFSLNSPFDIEFDEYFIRTKKNFFNWTMTYRMDSDIPFPFGIIRQKETAYTPPNLEKIRSKTKMIAWIHNKCDTKGAEKMMNNMQELRRYIPIDTYGNCGSLNCTNCLPMIAKTYFFYLSFEDSMCDNYVTNRLYLPLKYDIIPIVIGKTDYKKLAPPGSVINVYDFQSTKQLADYLIQLSQRHDLYNGYFEWKNHYVVEDSRPTVLCKLCEMIHRQVEHSSYKEINLWYHEENKCYF